MNATVNPNSLNASTSTGTGKPQLQVSIATSGNLEVTLPDGRTLELRKDPLQSIYTILMAQAEGKMSMGTNGAPTRHQVWHMEQHSIFPDSRCTFCRREGRITKTRADFKKTAPGVRALSLDEL